MKKPELTEKELLRRDVICAFNRGQITRTFAARQLGVCVRQFHILRTRYKAYGDSGLIDRRRFTKGNFSKPSHLKAQVLGLIRAHYAALGPSAISRRLADDCGVILHVATLREWMTRAGMSTARRSANLIGEAAKAERLAKGAAAANRSRASHRSCLPPRLFRERRQMAAALDSATVVRPSKATSKRGSSSNVCIANDNRQSTTATDLPKQQGRIPSMAELDQLLASRGTSAEVLDEFAVDLAIELMKKLERPVTEDEIESYIGEQEPYLLPLLQLIDATREAHAQRYKARGKRLTIEQRQSILGMLHQGVRDTDIARAFGISTGSLETYKRQLHAMAEDDRRRGLT